MNFEYAAIAVIALQEQRDEALKRIAELEAALQWTLDEGGWRLLYYANPAEIPAIIDASDIHNAKVRKP